MDNAENAQKVKVAKEDPAEKKRQRCLCKTESTQAEQPEVHNTIE